MSALESSSGPICDENNQYEGIVGHGVRVSSFPMNLNIKVPQQVTRAFNAMINRFLFAEFLVKFILMLSKKHQ